MILKKDSYSVQLPDGKKLLLKRGEDWRDFYLETILLPLLNGEFPPNTEQIASSKTAECWNVHAEGLLLFIKFFHFRDIIDKLSILRKTRSERAWEGGMLLQKMGFNTPDLIAQGEVVKKFKIEKNFLITKTIKPSLNVIDYLNTFPETNQTRKNILIKRSAIMAIGRLIGRLHKVGIFHGDLRPGNILIEKSANMPLFYFIDNERNKYFSKGIPPRLRKKNLVQINMIIMPQITFTDRLRFFNAYLGENPDLKLVAKDWIRNVFLTTWKRLQKKLVK